MTYSRRRALHLTGGTMLGLVSAGCLSNVDPGSGDDDGGDDNGTGDGDDTQGGDDDPGGDGDADDYSIDGRLHNEGTETQTFALTIRDEEDEVVAEDEWDVEAGDSLSVPAVGRPGEPRTFEVEVDGATATETFEFDVDDTPGERNGSVDITYADDAVEIAFTPSEEDNGSGEELPRVDEPPYEITEPACGDEGDRDPLWLCENMDDEPSMSFEQAISTGQMLADEGLTGEPDAEGDQYYVTLLTDDGDRDRVDDDVGGPAATLIEEADFEDEIVLVVQTGWGSGSETPHLKRIEERDDGIHAFGCSRRPCIGTTDVTVRTAVARLDRPESLDAVLVSLTEAPDRRVNVAADEGVVTISAE